MRHDLINNFAALYLCSGGDKIGLQKVVLFSKLNTLKFPTPDHIIKYLDRVLAPARMLEFKLRLRRVPEGTPYPKAHVEVEVGEEKPVKTDREGTDREGKVSLRLPFGKDFVATGSGCVPNLCRYSASKLHIAHLILRHVA